MDPEKGRQGYEAHYSNEEQQASMLRPVSEPAGKRENQQCSFKCRVIIVGKPEYSEQIDADMVRICKLLDPWCCEAAVLTTEMAMLPLVS
eukprot:g39557.t1